MKPHKIGDTFEVDGETYIITEQASKKYPCSECDMWDKECHAYDLPSCKKIKCIFKRIEEMTRSDIYEFEGFRFEVFKGLIPPRKLRKDNFAAAREGRKFWKAYGKWANLSKEKQERYKVNK